MDDIKSIESDLNNKYEIMNVIGVGGMGAIYLALDLKLRRKVAIKIIHKQYISDPECRARFIREAQTVARFDHPNIIKIYDFDSADDFDYFVMPYVEGLTYKACMAEAEGVDLKKNIAILMDVARALEYAHGKGIIHRDLKPANFMIKSDDGRVLLMDFGTSKDLVDPDITLPDTMLGTPKYMSPEQVHLGGKEGENTENVHFKSDLYSLGVILYEALAGKYPFSATNMISLCMCHLNEMPEPPKRVNPEIPDALNDLIMSLISKNPNDRTSGAGEVVQRLEVILKTLETSASVGRQSTIGGRTTIGGRGRQFSNSMNRQNKRFPWIPVGLSVGIVSILIAAGVYLFWPSSHGTNEIKQTRNNMIEVKEDTDHDIQNEYAVVDIPIQTPVKADPKVELYREDAVLEETSKKEAPPQKFRNEKEGAGVEVGGLEIIKSPAITLTTSQPGYQIGEKLFINIKVLRPCFLAIFYQDVYGDLIQVYPNIYAQSQKISKLTDILIPESAWGVDLEMVGPEGKETVIALSGDSPLDICEEDYSKQPFYALSPGEKKRLAALMVESKKSKMPNIDVQQVSFHIY